MEALAPIGEVRRDGLGGCAAGGRLPAAGGRLQRIVVLPRQPGLLLLRFRCLFRLKKGGKFESSDFLRKLMMFVTFSALAMAAGTGLGFLAVTVDAGGPCRMLKRPPSLRWNEEDGAAEGGETGPGWCDRRLHTCRSAAPRGSVTFARRWIARRPCSEGVG